MYLQNPDLLNRIHQIAETAEIRTNHKVKFEEYIALPFFGQIILRFTLDQEDITFEELDCYESMLYDISEDEFLIDFMGSVYQKAGMVFSELDDRLLELSEIYADEPVFSSVHSAGIKEDETELLKLAGIEEYEKVWEIQVEEDNWILLIMGKSNRKIKEIKEPIKMYVGEVSEKQCTGLMKAAFYAKRNKISLGRLLSDKGL